jgi:VWFA-related protein
VAAEGLFIMTIQLFSEDFMLIRTSYSTALALLAATALATAQAPTQPPTIPAGASGAQSDSVPAPEVTFRTEVNYVEEDVRVVDGRGNFVRNLRREDFQLAEDGKAQKISTFGMVDLPIVSTPRPLFAGRDALPIEPDVSSNDQVLDGRLYLILMDDYHVAPLRSQNARNLARRFVLEKLGPNDQAAVVATSGNLRMSQDFTQNRRLLVDAIDHFVGQKLASATLNRVDQRARELADQQASDDGVQPITPENMYTEDMEAPERMYKARAALNSLRSISEWMSAIQGRRKALIYISEGVDYNLYDMFSGADPSVFNFENFNMVQQETWDTISAASRSNVQIYPIDPRGLTNMAQENIEIQGLPLLALHLGPESLVQELATSQMNLRQLAEETGGVAAVGTNDMNRAFDRIVQENSSYYVLGYYPINEKHDGKLRRINVKVSGYPDAQVTFRKRYAAPRGKAPKNTMAGKAVDPAAGITAELMSTIASPLPKTGMGLRLSAVAHKGQGKQTDLEVVIETSGKDLTFREANGTFNDKVSLQVGVFDKEGKVVVTERPDIDLALRPETHDRVLEHGFRIVRHLSVAPGRYQLRVAAQDNGKTKQGSAHLDVDVPDYSKEAIGISGVALAATSDRSPFNWKDPFGGGLPTAPTTVREFASTGEVAAFVEVYDNQPMPVHHLDITTTVRADDGQVVFTNSAERSTEELHGTAGAFGYSVRIPLTGWTPGLYVLRIDAKSRVGNSTPVSRVIQLRVKQ